MLCRFARIQDEIRAQHHPAGTNSPRAAAFDFDTDILNTVDLVLVSGHSVFVLSGSCPSIQLYFVSQFALLSYTKGQRIFGTKETWAMWGKSIAYTCDSFFCFRIKLETTRDWKLKCAGCMLGLTVLLSVFGREQQRERAPHSPMQDDILVIRCDARGSARTHFFVGIHAVYLIQ